MTAAGILAGAQRFFQQAFPCSIQFAGQTASITCGTSGLSKQMFPDEGTARTPRKISFWVPIAAFPVAAGEPVLPREQTRLLCLSPAPLAAQYQIDEVLIDPAAVNVTLLCQQLPR